MAKKKKRNDGGIFKGLFLLFQAVLLLVARCLPLFLFGAIGAGVFFGVRQALYADSSLIVKKITINPHQAVSVVQRDRIESQYLGRNVLRADLKSIEMSLEKDPMIQTALVRRQMPGELNIDIVKRYPIAFIHFERSEKLGVISQDGMILDFVNPREATGLVVEVPEASMVSVGQIYKNPAFFELVKFLELYQAHRLAAKEPVIKALIDHLGNTSVYFPDNLEIRLGRRPSQRIEAFGKIDSLLESEIRKKIEYLDLQFDDVVVKQKKGVK